MPGRPARIWRWFVQGAPRCVAGSVEGFGRTPPDRAHCPDTAAYVERSTGEMLLGPPKSKAGRRVVGIPTSIVPALREHMAIYVKDEPGALVFPGVMGSATSWHAWATIPNGPR